MGSWFMNLSDYMGGPCLWKFNSMGGWVKKKCLFLPPGFFFWNSPKINHQTSEHDFLGKTDFSDRVEI